MSSGARRLHACLLGGFLSLAALPALGAQDCLESGRLAIRDGQTAQALSLLDRCKREFPENPEVYYYSGVALMAEGQAAEAAAELGRAWEMDPEKGDYALAYADLLAHAGQTQPALEILGPFQSADRVARLADSKLWILSDLYFRLEKPEEALEVLALLEERTEENPAIDFRRGQVHLKNSRPEAALESFQKAAAGLPASGAPVFGMAMALRLQNKPADSRDLLQKALRLEPGNPEYLRQLGETHLALNQPQEAVRALTPLEESGQAAPEILRLLAQAYRTQGDPLKAERYARRAQEMAQARQEASARQERDAARVLRGEELLQAGEVDQALRLFQQVAADSPENWDAHNYLAKIYLSSGLLTLAHPHLRQLLELQPKSVEGNFLMAEYLYQRRDYTRARSYAETAHSLYPGHGALRNLLGNIYLGLGLREKALEEYEAAVQLEPERQDFRSNYEVTRQTPGR